MNLDESDPTQCIVYASLTFQGAPLPSNHAFSAGDLKLYFADGTTASAVNLPVAVAGAIVGSFKIQVDRAQLQKRGDMLLQLASATVDPWSVVVPVDYPPLYANDSRLAHLDANVSSGFTASTDAIAAAVWAKISTAVLARVTPPSSSIGSYDVGDLEPPLQVTLPLDGVHVDLTAATAVNLRWKKPDGTTTTVPMIFVDKIRRIVQRVWTAGDTAQAGLHTGEVVITWPGGTETAEPVYQWVVRAPI